MKGNLVRIAAGVLTAFVFWSWGSSACEVAQLRGERDIQAVRADSLAAEAAAERLKMEGWDVLIQESDPALVQSALDSLPLVRDELAAARVRVSSLSRALVSAAGQVRVDTVHVDTVMGVHRAEWQDSVLWASTSFWYETSSFGELNYRLEPQPILIIQGETGDGRGWFSATSPTLNVVVDTAFFSLPEPEVVVRNPFMSKLKWGVGGAAVGIVLQTLLGND